MGTGKATPGCRDCLTFTRTLGLIGPAVKVHYISMACVYFSTLSQQGHIRPGRLFFAYILLNIECKRDSHEDKKCSPYNLRGIAYFYDFF